MIKTIPAVLNEGVAISAVVDTPVLTYCDLKDSVTKYGEVVYFPQNFKLQSVWFHLRRKGNPVSAIARARVYNVSGTAGSGGTPTGDYLAESTNTLNIDTLSTTAEWIKFNFSPETFSGNKAFTIELMGYGTFDGNNDLQVGEKLSTLSQKNGVYFAGLWQNYYISNQYNIAIKVISIL